MNDIITKSLCRAAFLVPTLASPAYAARTDVVTRFDEHLRGELPAVLSIRHRADGEDDDIEGSLVLTERLPAEARFPAGDIGVMYGGTLDGKDIVATRVEDHVDIVDGAHGTRRLVDVESPAPPRTIRSVDPTVPEGVKTLNVHFFIHETIRERFTVDGIHDDYVAWWLKDMASVLPSIRIVVHYHVTEQSIWNTPLYFTARRGIVGLDLLNTRNLQIIENAAEGWIARQKNPAEAHLQKFVLLAGGTLPNGRYGSAFQEGAAAIVSLDGSYRMVAHMLGHLLGADHNDSAVLYRGGWWCESNMYPQAFDLRSKCYVYTKENDRRIRNYVIGGPGAAFHRPVVIEG